MRTITAPSISQVMEAGGSWQEHEAALITARTAPARAA
jgi:hypothetical protein